jgi:hypothetical protein
LQVTKSTPTTLQQAALCLPKTRLPEHNGTLYFVLCTSWSRLSCVHVTVTCLNRSLTNSSLACHVTCLNLSLSRTFPRVDQESAYLDTSFASTPPTHPNPYLDLLYHPSLQSILSPSLINQQDFSPSPVALNKPPTTPLIRFCVSALSLRATSLSLQGEPADIGKG